MSEVSSEPRPSAGKSTFIGIMIGTSVLILYLAAGVLFESWNVGVFSSKLTAERAGTFLLLSGMAVTTFGIPVALYLHSRMITPLAILCFAIIGWLVVGISSGIIGEIFGLSLYALWLSPLYGALYFIFGGAEYVIRKRASHYLVNRN